MSSHGVEVWGLAGLRGLSLLCRSCHWFQAVASSLPLGQFAAECEAVGWELAPICLRPWFSARKQRCAHFELGMSRCLKWRVLSISASPSRVRGEWSDKLINNLPWRVQWCERYTSVLWKRETWAWKWSCHRWLKEEWNSGSASSKQLLDSPWEA